MALLNCVLVTVLLTTIVSAGDVPDFIHICTRNDPNLDTCMIESVEALKPYLMRGSPEHNIPSLEPLLLPEMVAAEGTGIRVTARDVRAYGASDFTLTNFKVDLNQLRFVIDLDLPNLYMQGLYEVDGRVLLLPIRGSGPMSGNFTQCTGSVNIQGEMRTLGDKEEHLQIVDFKLKITIGKGTLKLENLFGGDRVLGDLINQAINSNFHTFIKELQPLVEKALAEAFLFIANNILSQFTFNQLFPAS